MSVPMVSVETVIADVPNLQLVGLARAARQNGTYSPIVGDFERVPIPAAATRTSVPENVYDGYRLGLVSACADVVLVQEQAGVPKVPLIRRAQPPFGNEWWVMGGVVFNYRPIHQLLLYKAFQECGNARMTIDEFVARYDLSDSDLFCLGVNIVGCLGVCRTVASDMAGTGKVCDTINVCYMAIADPEVPLHHDKDHTAIRWVTMEELMSDWCGHWYPKWAARKALEIYRAT